MVDLKEKKILITGADGFLGKHLVENLTAKRQVPLSNLYLPKFEELDLRNWESCQQAVKGQQIVIHLAAKVGGIGFNKEKPGELFFDNIIMGTQLMEAARQEGIEKFVSICTVCAYPKFAPVPFREEDLWNGYPEETNASYGLSKKMAIVQSQAYKQQYGFNAISLLLVNLYGPGDNFNPQSSHVIAAVIKKAYEAKKNNQALEVWGTGKATREFLYVKDAAEAIALAAEKYDKADPINIGNGCEISIKDLVEKICQIMNFRGEIRWDHSKPDGQPSRRLDVSRAKEEFGFAAQTSFDQGLKNMIDDYESHIHSI